MLLVNRQYNTWFEQGSRTPTTPYYYMMHIYCKSSSRRFRLGDPPVEGDGRRRGANRPHSRPLAGVVATARFEESHDAPCRCKCLLPDNWRARDILIFAYRSEAQVTRIPVSTIIVRNRCYLLSPAVSNKKNYIFWPREYHQEHQQIACLLLVLLANRAAYLVTIYGAAEDESVVVLVTVGV